MMLQLLGQELYTQSATEHAAGLLVKSVTSSLLHFEKHRQSGRVTTNMPKDEAGT